MSTVNANGISVWGTKLEVVNGTGFYDQNAGILYVYHAAASLFKPEATYKVNFILENVGPEIGTGTYQGNVTYDGQNAASFAFKPS
jgi:hypothetical protein